MTEPMCVYVYVYSLWHSRRRMVSTTNSLNALKSDQCDKHNEIVWKKIDDDDDGGGALCMWQKW